MASQIKRIRLRNLLQTRTNKQALSRIKINHFIECALIHSKIFANNETDDDNQKLEPEEEFDYQILADYFKLEFINKQLVDKTKKHIVVFLWKIFLKKYAMTFLKET